MDWQQPRGPREKFLNIIYFIDSNKTRTLKFNLIVSYIALGALGSTILWSLVSTILLYRAYEKSDLQTERTRDLLSTIFSYQTRYDEVYERTYPDENAIPKKLPLLSDYDSNSDSLKQAPTPPSSNDSSSMKMAAKPIVPPPKPGSPTNSEIHQQANATSQAHAAGDDTEADPDIPETEPDTAEAADTPPTNSKSVQLNKFKVTQDGKNLKLTFAIKNLIRPNRAVGYVVGYATFIDLEGAESTVSSPKGFLTKGTIEQRKLPRPHRFSIRYYTKKTLVFEVPTEKGGTFNSIKIVIGGKNIEKTEIVYNVKDSEGAFAPIVETTPNTENENNTEQKPSTSL